MVTYKAIRLKIDSLFSSIKRLTNIDGRSRTPQCTMENLQNHEYQIFIFNHIKSQIQVIFDDLTKLHAYVTEDSICGNLELIGRFLNDLLEAWDVFFNGMSTMRRKGMSDWLAMHMKMYHKLAARETYQCQGRIKRVKERLRGRFIDYEFRKEEQAKQLYAESRFHFTMRSTAFDLRPCRDKLRNDCKVEMTTLLEQQLSDSSIDTSDDEDLMQEVDNFCKNLENWLEEEEIRKEKEEAKRLRMLKRQATVAANSPIGKSNGNSEQQPTENGSGLKRNCRSNKKDKKRKRKRASNGSETSDSDPSSDGDFSDSDNPEWQELREKTNGFRNMRRRTYETRQNKKEPKPVPIKKSANQKGHKRMRTRSSGGSTKSPGNKSSKR